jgi:hypothetical protein
MWGSGPMGLGTLLKRRHELTDAEYMRFSGWTLNYPEIGHVFGAGPQAITRLDT